MRVLMVSEVYTHPHDAGNRQRIYRECCEMKKLGWQIDFLYWGSVLTPNMSEMISFFGEEHFYLVNKTNISIKYQIKSYIRNIMNKKNISRYIALKYAEDECYYEEVGESVRRLCDRNQYDIVWLQYFTQSNAFENLSGNIYKVVDTLDKFANRNKIFQKKARIPEFYYTSIRGERKALSRADLVIAIQDKEKEYFIKLLKHSSTEVKVVGDMVNICDSSFCNSINYGFIGAKNGPNKIGIEWFIDNVLPIIKKLEPRSNLIIAGGVCEIIPDSGNYIKLGYVDNIKEFYDKIAFAINPIQNGTGLNIKSIEALSYMKPLITTSIGAKGLHEANEAIEIYDEPESYAKAVADLLNDIEKNKIMGQKAELFIHNYNRKNIDVLLEIEKIVEEKRYKSL